MSSSGTLTNSETGIVNNTNMFTNYGTISNDGIMNNTDLFTNNQTLDNRRIFINEGTISNITGTINSTNTLTNNGSIDSGVIIGIVQGNSPTKPPSEFVSVTGNMVSLSNSLPCIWKEGIENLPTLLKPYNLNGIQYDCVTTSISANNTILGIVKISSMPIVWNTVDSDPIPLPSPYEVTSCNMLSYNRNIYIGCYYDDSIHNYIIKPCIWKNTTMIDLPIFDNISASLYCPMCCNIDGTIIYGYYTTNMNDESITILCKWSSLADNTEYKITNLVYNFIPYGMIDNNNLFGYGNNNSITISKINVSNNGEIVSLINDAVFSQPVLCFGNNKIGEVYFTYTNSNNEKVLGRVDGNNGDIIEVTTHPYSSTTFSSTMNIVGLLPRTLLQLTGNKVTDISDRVIKFFINDEIDQMDNITKDITVYNSKTLNINSSISIGSGVTVTIQSGGILNITDGISTLTNNGFLNLHTGSIMNLGEGNVLNISNGVYNPNSSTIDNKGTIVNEINQTTDIVDDIIVPSTKSLNIKASVSIAAGKTVTIQPRAILNIVGQNVTLTNNGSIYLSNDSRMSIGIGNKMYNFNGLYSPNSATVDNNGEIVNEINQMGDITNNIEVRSGKTLNIMASSSIVSGSSVTVYSGGILNIVDGSSLLTVDGILTLYEGSTLNIGTGNTINWYNGNFTPNNATIVNNGSIVRELNILSIMDNNITIGYGKTMNINASTSVASNATLIILPGGILNVIDGSSLLTVDGTLTLYEGSILNIGTGNTINWYNGNFISNNVTIVNNGSIVRELNITNTNDISGNIIVDSGKTINIKSSVSIPLNSTITIHSGGILNITDGSSTLTNNGGSLILLDGSTMNIGSGNTLNTSNGDYFLDDNAIIDNKGTVVNETNQITNITSNMIVPAFKTLNINASVSIAPYITVIISKHGILNVNGNGNGNNNVLHVNGSLILDNESTMNVILGNKVNWYNGTYTPNAASVNGYAGSIVRELNITNDITTGDDDLNIQYGKTLNVKASLSIMSGKIITIQSGGILNITDGISTLTNNGGSLILNNGSSINIGSGNTLNTSNGDYFLDDTAIIDNKGTIVNEINQTTDIVDDIIVPSTKSLNIKASVSIAAGKTVTIQPRAILNIVGQNVTLTNNGSIYLSNDSRMSIGIGNKMYNFNGLYSPNSATVDNNGEIVNEINQMGDITNNIEVRSGKTLNIMASSSIVSGSSVTVYSGGILNIVDGSSLLTVDGILTLYEGSTLNIGTGNTINWYNGNFTPNNATIVNNGSIVRELNITNTGDISGNIVVDSGKTLNIKASVSIPSTSTITVNSGGILNITDHSSTLTNNGSITLLNGSSMNIGSGNVLITSTGIYTPNNATVNNEGTFVNEINLTSNIVSSSSVIIVPNGKTLNIKASITSAANITVQLGGTLNIFNGFTFTNTGSLVLNAGSIMNIGSQSTLSTLNGIYVPNSATINNNGFIDNVINQTTNISNTLVVNPGSILNIKASISILSTGNVTIKSGAILNIGDGFTFTNTGSLVLDNDSALFIGVNSTLDIFFGVYTQGTSTIVVNKGTINNQILNLTSNVTSNIVIRSGQTLNIKASITIPSSISVTVLSGGTFNLNYGSGITLTVNGNLYLNVGSIVNISSVNNITSLYGSGLIDFNVTLGGFNNIKNFAQILKGVTLTIPSGGILNITNNSTLLVEGFLVLMPGATLIVNTGSKLSHYNNYTPNSATIINNGIITKELIVSTSSSIATTTVTSGTTLTIMATCTTTGTITVNSGGTLNIITGPLYTIGNTVSTTYYGSLMVKTGGFLILQDGATMNIGNNANKLSYYKNYTKAPNATVNNKGTIASEYFVPSGTMTTSLTIPFETDTTVKTNANIVIPIGVTLTIQSGVVLTIISGTSIVVYGTIIFETGSTVNIIGSLNITTNGTYIPNNATVSVTGYLYQTINQTTDITSSITLPNGTSMSINASISIASGVTVRLLAGSALNITNGTSILMVNGSLVSNGGAQLTINAGNKLISYGLYDLTTSSTITNNGSIFIYHSTNITYDLTIRLGTILYITAPISIAVFKTLTIETGGTLNITNGSNTLKNLGNIVFEDRANINIGVGNKLITYAPYIYATYNSIPYSFTPTYSKHTNTMMNISGMNLREVLQTTNITGSYTIPIGTMLTIRTSITTATGAVITIATGGMMNIEDGSSIFTNNGSFIMNTESALNIGTGNKLINSPGCVYTPYTPRITNSGVIIV